MAKKSTLAKMLEKGGSKIKEAFAMVDEGMERKDNRGIIMVSISNVFDDERIVELCRLYMDWKYPVGGSVKQKPTRTQEDILEFGILDDDEEDDDDSESDDDSDTGDELERLLHSFIAPSSEEDDKEYVFHVGIDDKQAQLPVYGIPNQIDLSDYLLLRKYFLHIDLEIPEGERDVELRVEIKDVKSAFVRSIMLKPTNVMLFRDGDRMHLDPICLFDIFEDKLMNHPDREESIVFTLFIDGDKYMSNEIPVIGPETGSKPKTDGQTISEKLAELDNYQGWEGFKKKVAELVSRCNIGSIRSTEGLAPISPQLHTAIMGNTGTGKTTAAKYLVQISKLLGCLDSASIEVTSVAQLVSSSVNGETEAINNAINKSKGGALIFEAAHALHNPEKKNYNSEDRIIRALVDALDNKDQYPRWMLILIGEPNGMASLFSSNPELAKHFPNPILLEDFKPNELSTMIDGCCSKMDLQLTPEARQKLESYILHKYKLRGPGFENAWLVQRLFDNQIVPRMFDRLGGEMNLTKDQLTQVLPEDIPAIKSESDAAMQELDELIGLGKVKTRVRDYLNAIQLAARRMEMGLATNMPRLHMAFLGNPGTGKTTVAGIIGKVFASWGILSGGRVIRTEKSEMVGQYIGETEFKMQELLSQARGNILFIDEAYQLVEGGERDHGRIVMNSLLTELGKDNQDMVVILAGYTAPMKRLLESNEGIESRFPNVFNFEDYTTDELVEIGKLMISRQSFILTPGAEANMRAIIQEESEKPSPRFGNGRFVSNLLQNEILATLGARTSKLKEPTKEDLSTILPEDVVIGKKQKDAVFDDVAIDAALARLDALAGLDNVKKAIHNFVQSARYLHSIGEPYVGKGLLSWRFIGSSGTGKSTVAGIMAVILKGMRLIANSHIAEIKGERIIGVSEHECYTVLEEAVKKSCNGLIFIDVDDRKLMRGEASSYGRVVELIRLKVEELTVEAGGECALILADLDAPNRDFAEQMTEAGIYEFDHTLVFKDFTADELFDILCSCLRKFEITFETAAEKHMRSYLETLCSSVGANARTMKLMSRTIYQQVILRESGLAKPPKSHKVELADIESIKWDGKKGKIGF